MQRVGFLGQESVVACCIERHVKTLVPPVVGVWIIFFESLFTGAMGLQKRILVGRGHAARRQSTAILQFGHQLGLVQAYTRLIAAGGDALLNDLPQLL